MLQIYRVIRLVIIACIITYFLGCSWFLYCTVFSDEKNELGEHMNDFVTNFDLGLDADKDFGDGDVHEFNSGE
jgi:hypothetical protein